MLNKSYSIMKRRMLAGLGVMALLVVPGLTLADDEGDDNRRCDFRGSWYGFLPTLQLDFITTLEGGSGSQGIYILEIPGFELTALGAVKVSNFRGTWERMDKRSFAFTLLGYGVDANGQSTVIVKISGINNISRDCNTITIDNTNEIFSGDQDPFGDEAPAFGYIRGGVHYASRMRVDPPAEPL